MSNKQNYKAGDRVVATTVHRYGYAFIEAGDAGTVKDNFEPFVVDFDKHPDKYTLMYGYEIGKIEESFIQRAIAVMIRLSSKIRLLLLDLTRRLGW